jgi:FkbM family methyltransferase
MRLLANPSARRRFLAQCAFLRPFVPKGGLAFDIGANVGDFTAMLLELVARPVAVEPTPESAAAFSRRFPKVPLERVAMADHAGVGRLLVGAKDTDNTLSTAYGAVLEDKRGVKLTAIDVPLSTMDELALKYGQPKFVKIDVEGYEAEVVSGMSFDPPALSFEFHSSLPDQLSRCLGALDDRGYRFRPVIRTATEWAADWQAAGELLTFIEERGTDDSLLWGDIYCVKK